MINNHEIWTTCTSCGEEYDLRINHFCNKKKIYIDGQIFMVQIEVHDLLCYYSNTVQAAVICRQAQKEYYRKQDQDRLRKAKAMEKKLDQLLLGKKDESQRELFR